MAHNKCSNVSYSDNNSCYLWRWKYVQYVVLGIKAIPLIYKTKKEFRSEDISESLILSLYFINAE